MGTNEKERNLLFLDTETTGLTPDLHEIIEIACVLTDPTGEKTLSVYEAKLMPQHIERAEARALEVNGYSKDTWEATATPADKVAADIQRIATDAVLVGQNISFDIDFVTRFLIKNYHRPTWHYHKVDTATLAWPLYKAKLIEGLSLNALCEFFERDRPKVHRALEDVHLCRMIYLDLMGYLNVV